MSEKITLHVREHNYNAGLVGLVNILGKDNMVITENELSFPQELLENFTEKYFEYFIRRYEKTLSWYKIVSFKEIIEVHENEEFQQFNEKTVAQFNDYVTDVRRYLKSSSYKAAYPLIDDPRDVLELEKKLALIGRLKKKETFVEKREEIILEVKGHIAVLKEIIDYCESPDGKKYLAGKNVIYTIIKNAWEGVSFLFRQTKEKDMYIDYDNYFVQPVVDYFEEEKEKYRYNCSNCDAPMKQLKNDLRFLNKTGFDVSRKSSHVWAFQNDIAVCPLCKLIYSCIPAGFTYVFSQGLFVNASGDLRELLTINENMQKNVLDGQLEPIRGDARPYKALIQALQQEEIRKTAYEAEGVTVVQYENETYRFSILPDVALQTIQAKSAELSRLVNAGFKEIKLSFSLYKLVIQKLFNRERLFQLIHKLVVYELTTVEGRYYNTGHLIDIIQINAHFMGGISSMMEQEAIEPKRIYYARRVGQEFTNAYDARYNVNKVRGIAHQLLNALKVGDQHLFMDVILRCYSYLDKPVASIFPDMLKNEETFKTLGYAFITGMIGKEGKNLKEEQQDEE